MATINPRINVTLPKDVAHLLNELARKEGKSASSLSKELLLEALERREDFVLSRLAEKRETGNKGKHTVSHDDAWG